MKRRGWFFFLFAGGLLLFGTAHGIGDEADCRTKAAALAQQTADGDASALFRSFSPGLKKAFSTKNLADRWEKKNAAAGAFWKWTTPESMTGADGMMTVETTAAYEKRAVLFRF